MSDKVSARVKAGGAGMIDEIVLYKAMPSQAQAGSPAGLGAEMFGVYENLPMRVMRIPAHALPALANGKGVEFVTLDLPVEANSLSARQTGRLRSRLHLDQARDPLRGLISCCGGSENGPADWRMPAGHSG